MSHQLDTINSQILKYLSEGLTVKEIAPKVFLSYEGVNWRIDKMKERADCKNITELVFYHREIIEWLRKAS
jgi:DNA-binding NarL/FixJ family response regulator